MAGAVIVPWFALRKLRPTLLSDNANLTRRKAEGRDDAVSALNPDVDDELFEQGLSLTGGSIQHCVSGLLPLHRG